MNKTIVVAFIKIVFLYLPASIIVFTGCYFCSIFLKNHGMGGFVFIPAVLTIALLILLFKLMFAKTLKEMKRQR